MITDEHYEKYKKLAYKIAIPFMLGFPYIAEDIKASAMLGLCEGIKRALELKHHDPGAMIVLKVQYEIVKCLQSNYCIIRLPRSLIRKERLKAYINKEEFSIAKLYPKIILLKEQHISESVLYNTVEWRNIKQHILDVKFSDIERQVLVYRLSGYTYKEIGEFLEYSDVGIIKIMERVRKKWLKQIK
jgi:DNA-directed RNA polymerase specialized sigma subunit